MLNKYKIFCLNEYSKLSVENFVSIRSALCVIVFVLVKKSNSSRKPHTENITQLRDMGYVLFENTQTAYCTELKSRMNCSKDAVIIYT